MTILYILGILFLIFIILFVSYLLLLKKLEKHNSEYLNDTIQTKHLKTWRH